MTETITRLYDSYAHAEDAVKALKSHGFANDTISTIRPAEEPDLDANAETSGAGGGAEIGSGVGVAAGAGVGLATGLGLMAIPGVGPVVAAGWLAATAVGAVAGAVAGAAAGGIIGAMTGSGVEEGDAHVYAEGMRRGGTLVTVLATEERAAEARLILDEYGPIDPAVRGTLYRKEGWKRFDETAPPYVPATGTPGSVVPPPLVGDGVPPRPISRV